MGLVPEPHRFELFLDDKFFRSIHTADFDARRKFIPTMAPALWAMGCILKFIGATG
jgi:hypothetical protein